jgi:DNA-binding HxlR family transcriptional regulator
MGAELTPFCPAFQRAIEIVGRRWTGAIVRAMLAGRTRFSEIAATVPGLSARLLSERLKELEAEGIVTRTVIPETPVRVEYHLTEAGRALGEVVRALARWAETYGSRRRRRVS